MDEPETMNVSLGHDHIYHIVGPPMVPPVVDNAEPLGNDSDDSNMIDEENSSRSDVVNTDDLKDNWEIPFVNDNDEDIRINEENDNRNNAMEVNNIDLEENKEIILSVFNNAGLNDTDQIISSPSTPQAKRARNDYEDDSLYFPGGDRAEESLDEFLGGEDLVENERGGPEGDVPDGEEADMPVGAVDEEEEDKGSVINATPSTAINSTPCASTSRARNIEMVRVAELFNMTVGQVSEEYINEMQEEKFKALVKAFVVKTEDSEELEEDQEEEENEKEDEEKGNATEEKDDAAAYEAELIVRKLRPPRNANDKVFIVVWKRWNLSACTLCSLNDLKGSEYLLEEYLHYDQTIDKIIAFYANTATPASKQKLELLTDFYGCWLSDKQWAKEKGTPENFEAVFQLWAWIDKSREWNEIDRRAFPSRDHYPLYLEYFHQGAKLPSDFKFIVNNVFSRGIRKTVEEMSKKHLKTGCTCSCTTGPCSVCLRKMRDHEPCRLEKNKITDIHPDGLRSRSFQSVICAPGKCPNKENPCCQPRREFSLLIGWRPAVDGVGVYATCDIPKHTVVCEYTGEVIAKATANKRERSYQYSLPHSKVVIDAKDMGNEARFINHSCEPNAGPFLLHTGSIEAVPRLYIVAMQDIKQGQEILIDYHPSYTFNKNKKPPPNSSECFCFTPTCRRFV